MYCRSFTMMFLENMQCVANFCDGFTAYEFFVFKKKLIFSLFPSKSQAFYIS